MNSYLHDEDKLYAYLAGWEAPRYYTLHLRVPTGKIPMLLPYCDLSFSDKRLFLEKSARRGNLEEVKYLCGLDFPCSRTVLVNAIESGNLDLVMWLLEFGCPFYIDCVPVAYRCGHMHIAEWLIAKGFADHVVDAEKIRNEVEWDQFEKRDCVAYAVKHDIKEIWMKCINDTNILGNAIKYNKQHIIKLFNLRKKSCVLHSNVASEANNFSLFKKLAYQKNFSSTFKNVYYRNFTRHGNLKAIKFLYKHFTLYHNICSLAFNNGFYNIVKWCMQQGARSNNSREVILVENPEYLEMAEMFGYEQFVKLYFESELYTKDLRIAGWIRKNVKTEFPMGWNAVSGGHIHVVRWMIDQGTLNVGSLINIARAKGEYEITKLLMKHAEFSDINNCSMDFNLKIPPTIWHYEQAIWHGAIRELEWCFEFPIDDQDQRLMSVAVRANCARSIKFLIKKGYKILGRKD